MSIARHHAEWLALLDISGPFLALPVLARVFPQGLDAPDADVARELRLAYEEWLDNSGGLQADPALHRTWAEWVLRRVLEMPDEVLRARHALPQGAPWPSVLVAEHGEELRPDFVVADPGEDGKARVLVVVVPPGQGLEKPMARSAWQASPATRMMTLLRGAKVRLGLLTNGEQWMLVDRPDDENATTGFASWYARLWLEEPLTLRAFRSLFGARRLFGVPDGETLEALLAQSAGDQQEVTDQLGYQVRRAVELLVQALDLADQNEGRRLLRDVPEDQLYEAALSVMMRLVFLLFAEEQNLLLLGDVVYDQHYAASTLLGALREDADKVGEEVLERRHDAWGRLLAIFRAVYGGFRHDRLDMPAYGGSLFDPDRFPFLEGRPVGSSWLDMPADPPQISNRVVLHLLEALQVLRVKVRDGSPLEARRLSFRALDIEQIGHVYEGLLDHAAVRAKEPILGLAGTREQEPELALTELEREAKKGEESFLAYLKERTGRSPGALKKAWAAAPDAWRAAQLRAACGNDEALYARVLPFAGLVRDDDYGRPTVIPAGSIYVTAGAERRATGTHYTPRSLTEPIVQHTLEPLVYHGPAEGLPREEWRLRPASDLLRLAVCDMAMGSGAFLVQACRYLSERLLEAWAFAERRDPGIGIREAELRDPGSGIRETEGTPGLIFDPSGGQHADSDVSRSGGLAEGDGSGGGHLSAHTQLPKGGAVRADQPDSAGGGLGAGEHRGGLRSGTPQGIPASPLDRAGIALGGGDTAATGSAPEVPGSGASAGALATAPGRGQDAQQADSGPRGAAEDNRYSREPERARSRIPDPGSRRLITPEGLLTADPAQAIPADPAERLVVARRLVADRCLYGVDKNPLAVEMAKLSLWLITLAKGRPFSFLDHALRCGDSLLGISDLEQLQFWALSEKDRNHKLDWVTGPVTKALSTAFPYRQDIRLQPTLDARDADHKRDKLMKAEQATGLVRLGADLLVAAAFAPDPKARKERRGRFLTRYTMLVRAASEGRDTRDTETELRHDADALLQGHRPFHWPLEFPEVFISDSPHKAAKPQRDLLDRIAAGDEDVLRTFTADLFSPGFSAVVGNPPFLGGKRISTMLGALYEKYLKSILADVKGGADLCAFFFLRAGKTLQSGGMSGLIATNTIAQGDTREIGLDQLVAQGYRIPRAIPSRPWPGTAGVEVAHVWLRNGDWRGGYSLNEQSVSGITPFLSEPGAASGNPERLKANAGKSFQGSIVLGSGFVLEPEQAQSLIIKEPRNAAVLSPYLNGEDLNSRPDQSPSRWVINFFDWPIERVQQYPDCLQILIEHVKPQRDEIVARGKQIHEYDFWKFWDKRPMLYATIAGMKRVLTVAATSRTLAFAFSNTRTVFSNTTYVFALDRGLYLAILQSVFHEMWAREYASSMKGDLRYTPSDVFETFPFPEGIEAISRQVVETQSAGQNLENLSGFAALHENLDQTGERYHVHRQYIMLQRQEGLTKTYNRYHAPSETSADIAELRRLHVEMDNAVAAAYGWADLTLGHGFHETKQGLRYTISEAARREVLDRLLRLNHERYAEEVEAGLHDKGAKKAGKGAGTAKPAAKAPAKAESPAAPQLRMDLGEAPAAKPAPSGNGGDKAYVQLKALLAQQGSLSNGEAQAALGVDGEAARRLLQRLVDEGVAAVVGQKRGTRYVWRR